jgi:hypothetical protein
MASSARDLWSVTFWNGRLTCPTADYRLTIRQPAPSIAEALFIDSVFDPGKALENDNRGGSPDSVGAVTAHQGVLGLDGCTRML